MKVTNEIFSCNIKKIDPFDYKKFPISFQSLFLNTNVLFLALFQKLCALIFEMESISMFSILERAAKYK